MVWQLVALAVGRAIHRTLRSADSASFSVVIMTGDPSGTAHYIARECQARLGIVAVTVHCDPRELVSAQQ